MEEPRLPPAAHQETTAGGGKRGRASVTSARRAPGRVGRARAGGAAGHAERSAAGKPGGRRPGGRAGPLTVRVASRAAVSGRPGRLGARREPAGPSGVLPRHPELGELPAGPTPRVWPFTHVSLKLKSFSV